jgi:predicted trehalose synthase
MTDERMLSADEILAMQDIEIEEVVVPEWGGGKVYVCGLTSAGKNAYESSLFEIKGKTQKMRLENATAKLLVRTLVDRDRRPLFTETQVEALGRKSAAVLERLQRIAQRLSGMTQAEVEELIKNSDAAPSDGSSSASL